LQVLAELLEVLAELLHSAPDALRIDVRGQSAENSSDWTFLSSSPQGVQHACCPKTRNTCKDKHLYLPEFALCEGHLEDAPARTRSAGDS